ncbi:hypothetical protein J2S42_003102 [Catenuloplanes indicus]|uniref:Uncharacterized protein n=1 Tax=Catenuloplanes indicus TaxID=137267 RepID=A0AAE3VY93_9ACTN|nr:hypothetical protein [Catenuloplanes indicus]
MRRRAGWSTQSLRGAFRYFAELSGNCLGEGLARRFGELSDEAGLHEAVRIMIEAWVLRKGAFWSDRIKGGYRDCVTRMVSSVGRVEFVAGLGAEQFLLD